MGYGLWFVVLWFCGLHRKIRLTQLWVELGCGKKWPASLPSTTTGGARKPPGSKVSVNNGQVND